MLALPLDDSYDDPQALFKAILEFVDGDDAFSMSHDELEDELQEQGRELMRRLLQRHLDRRAEQEPRLQVVDADGVERTRVEQGHHRPLKTVLGEVGVTRQAYRAPGKRNLYLADALLNLPVEEFSYGVRRAAAIEAAEGSYDSVVEGIQRQTGVKIGKRQVEELAARAAVDFNDFYARRLQVLAPAEDVLVISCDGKGIVMRPEALRDSTRAKAARASPKLKTRLSRGEKGNRKRMAEVGSVFDITPLPRSPTEILASAGQTPKAAPKARNKWVVASVIEDAAKVVHRVFDEAERRDPEHRRRWIALVDGQSHQIECIECTAARRNVRLTIVIDFVHVPSTCGRPPGASSLRATPTPRSGCIRRPSPSSRAKLQRSPAPFAAPPPGVGSMGPSVTPWSAPRATWSANASTSTTRPHWPPAGPSPPA